MAQIAHVFRIRFFVIAAAFLPVMATPLVACSSSSPHQGTSALPADGGDGEGVVCTADATQSFGEPALAGGCGEGHWQQTGQSCGPFSAGCRPWGDGLCYRLCTTSADCADPCAHSCRAMPYFNGGDTPSGSMPVCQPGPARHLPAACENALGACVASCRTGALTSDCVLPCWTEAVRCTNDACWAARQSCTDTCHSTHTDADAINACIADCDVVQADCRAGVS
jgi:hypothetical protein